MGGVGGGPTDYFVTLNSSVQELFLCQCSLSELLEINIGIGIYVKLNKIQSNSKPVSTT